MLMRRRVGGWRALWFVRSDKEVLALGMREKGTDVATARVLLAGLPDSFDAWQSASGQLPGRPGGSSGRRAWLEERREKPLPP